MMSPTITGEDAREPTPLRQFSKSDCLRTCGVKALLGVAVVGILNEAMRPISDESIFSDSCSAMRLFSYFTTDALMPPFAPALAKAKRHNGSPVRALMASSELSPPAL